MADVHLDQDEIDLIMQALMSLYNRGGMTNDQRERAAPIAFKLGMAHGDIRQAAAQVTEAADG